MPTYFARDEKALRIAAMPPVVNGRLQGTAAVDIADLNNAADKRSAPAQYELFGPGDVGAAPSPGGSPPPGAATPRRRRWPSSSSVPSIFRGATRLRPRPANGCD